jgi:hypothetical protein
MSLNLYMVKWGSFLKIAIISSILKTSIVNAAGVIAQTAPQTQQESIPLWKIVWDICKYPLLILVILVIVTFIVVKIIQWIIKTLKLEDNEVQQLVLMKIGLARSQAKFKYKVGWLFKWKKNTPIYLFYKAITGELMKEFFAVYMGDFTDNEGITWISFANRPLHWLLWFVPKIDVLACPQNDKIKFSKLTNLITQEYEEKEFSIVPAKVHFLNDEILVETSHIDRISTSFDMYIPILRSQDGKVIDPTHAIFQVAENLVLKKVQYDMLNSYANNIKKGMEMNVITKTKQKINDPDGSAES